MEYIIFKHLLILFDMHFNQDIYDNIDELLNEFLIWL